MRQLSTALVAVLSGTLIASLLYARESVAEDLHVDRNNMTATRDGSSLRPYATIQAALDEASAGDAVLVARGVYAENVRIQGKRLALRGGYAGAPSANYVANLGGDFSTQLPAVNVTTIQGAIATATVLLLDTPTGGSLVDGFTIRGGSHGIELDDDFTFPLLEALPSRAMCSRRTASPTTATSAAASI